uniref:Uncharacterized protein n=1 Tax=Kwoniella bestiolae CBS 10118 TaxID=1296100 RepID=A0A1B9GA66_9TREE|nr:hypothetical protein I302_02768 [Kwoniella bestiolae CBS 10118]OCF27918.1 hypothetical protein I302_02768 [Kwoniella bestiolae CBS 10118]
MPSNPFLPSFHRRAAKRDSSDLASPYDSFTSSASSGESSPDYHTISNPLQWDSKDIESYLHHALDGEVFEEKPPLTITYEEALVSVGWQMDNPHILAGYRQALGSIRGCIYSIYGYLHNETFNILTHLIGSIMFMIIFLAHTIIQALSSSTRLLDPSRMVLMKQGDVFALSIYLTACVVCLGMSASFHTLNCHSAKISRRAHRCDYAGIVVLGMGSILPVIHYAFHHQELYQILYSAGLTISTNLQIVLSKRYRKRRLLRTCTFLFLGCSTIIPILHLIISEGYAHAKRTISVDWIFTAGGIYILGACVYATRYPEKLYPGKFDTYFSSHQIFHSLVVVGCICQYIALRKMIGEKNAVMRLNGAYA